jgi:hypothetical protein
MDEIISSHLPDLVNQYISARSQRLAIEKDAAEIKEHEELLKKAIISKYQEQGLKSLGAANGIVKMSSSMEPIASDWLEIHAYIQSTGTFELLHRRLANLAVKERWEAGMELPGISKQEIFKLTVSGTKS